MAKVRHHAEEQYDEYTRRGDSGGLCDAHDAQSGSKCPRAMGGSLQLRLGRVDRRDEQQQALSAHTRRTLHEHVSISMWHDE